MTTPLSADEQKLRNKLARVLWDVDNKGKTFENLDARGHAFDAERKDYKAKATDVLRMMQRRGLQLSAVAVDVS